MPGLIQDLALILIAAAVVTLLFKALKQPLVLGYLIAGFLVGPNFHFFPSVQDPESISIWAEIGVIFMLFGLGLEFSFKKLSRVGKSASITATLEILAMLGIGYLTGMLLGWSKMDSLFLGGILSISSTTIIVRAFDELGLKGKSFVSLVFGVLIVEDVIAVLLLVLLSSIAGKEALSGSDLVMSTLRLGFFLVLWFLLGIYILPVLLRRAKRLLSDETLLIVSLGLCLMMVIVASHVGFSPALGAFVMGSILAETAKGPKIEHLLRPVQDLFSAVFFVSVGMLISLSVLREYFGVILLISAVTILGKLISTSVGALASGRSFKTSVQAGMSVAQIGEFSFIIATLGVSLKVTSGFLYPIAVAVSAVTTFTTPYLIQVSGRLAQALEHRLPEGLRTSLARYEMAMASESNRNLLSRVWRAYGIKIALNSVLVIAITLAASQLAAAYGTNDGETLNVLFCIATLILASPFLWAIFFGAAARGTQEELRGLQIGVNIGRVMIGLALAGFLVSHFLSLEAFSGVLIVLLTALGIFLFTPISSKVYARIEARFLSNLSAKDKAEKIPELAPWNASLAEFTVSPYSPVAGQSLENSRLKENFGVTVTMIERGGNRLLAPQRSDILWPADKLFLIGTEEQHAAVRDVLEAKREPPAHDADFGLASLVLGNENPFVGKAIRECGLREAVHGLIVGIERRGQRILNPDSGMILNSGDLIWLVGNRSLIKRLRT